MKKLYAVIGDPIAHSMSPTMHNDLFQFYGMDAHYHAFKVEKENLEAAVKGFKAIGVEGFNVTVPHKVNIIPLLDEMDPLAGSIGAVNTVVNCNGKFIGYNTDGSGYLKGLSTIMDIHDDLSVLIIGAGGAARAIYFTMAHSGVHKIDITNRTVERADVLVKDCPYQVQSKVLTIPEAEAALGEYDLIIQTTSIGMSPKIEFSPIGLQNLHAQAFVSDIIYNPLETNILQQAKQKGARVQNGIDMFVFQGALAFEKWTGIFPSTDRMKNTVLTQLGGIKC
ncbi:shikimate dehydrogenase [Bacillus massilinigeriensis]|uniref:shikimate dehydrogenase n=1 Tax=Bacillus massilionigeriensis TaxID=1805475 RepID=UPI00096B5AB8|nr:shikimate dehydrogenase [Bacillus massilionigeriensis]